MLKDIKSFISREIREAKGAKASRGRKKIFCVGFNKTGTTSLKRAFQDLDYTVADQQRAESLAAKHYFNGAYDSIIKFCRTAEVFQDVPFSCPDAYKIFDSAYPSSKFILTVRDTPDQWYQSITRFHSKLFGKSGAIPTESDLRAASHITQGFMHDYIFSVYGTPKNDPYNKDIMVQCYKKHIQEVKKYFSDRPEDLIVINVGKEGEYKRLVEFLGVRSDKNDFPWENRT